MIASTWRSLAECQYFCRVRDALVAVGEADLAEKLHAPFDHMPAVELREHFSAAGFENVQVDHHTLEFTVPGGIAQAIATAWSTVVGTELAAMPEGKQAGLRAALAGMLRELSNDGRTMGKTVSNVLTATRPTR